MSVTSNSSFKLAATALLLLLPAVGRAEPQYQLKRQLMPLVKPGLVVGDTAPEGWSHLIIKSHPRCRHGDIKDVKRMHVNMASLLTTSLFAEVRRSKRNPNEFILNRVAGGVSKHIDGKDIVITPDTQRELGANLGVLERILLSEFVKKQKTTTFIARGPQLAIFDTFIVLRIGRDTKGYNEEMVLRYAIIVDKHTGRLETFCWPIRVKDKKLAGVAGNMQWLPPNHVIICPLWVDKREINFVGIPSDKAFACLTVPPGAHQIPLPQNVGELLSQESYTAQDCMKIENWLMRIVNHPQAQQRHAQRTQPPR